MVQVVIVDNADRMSYSVNVPDVIVYKANGESRCCGGQVTKIYAGPGTEVRGEISAESFSSRSTWWNGVIIFSGRLVPYE